jgi:hypothetical protein
MADELRGWTERPEDELVSLSEAVEITGLDESTLRTLIDQGKFPLPIEYHEIYRRGRKERMGFYSRRAVERASRTALRGPAAPPASPAAADPAPIPRQPGS